MPRDFPRSRYAAIAVTEARGALEARLAVNVAGHDSTLVVPFNLERAAGRLTASGALSVRQSALGLIPFSVFLGALRVQDDMDVKFKLVAVAGQLGALRRGRRDDENWRSLRRHQHRGRTLTQRQRHLTRGQYSDVGQSRQSARDIAGLE